ncbi:aspartoacylase [Microcoleus sp. FACHB-1515]|uniref:aspartoacylase n=1 Tax=Cyanophyceae TaxID=3028117 RepID=UPI0016882A44|nr:aspartoacylase [Microcoleus sp. FACHB-1515]MBD2088342.1 aspartoacylase [Microcoleus sp. FACHB-1515]
MNQIPVRNVSESMRRVAIVGGTHGNELTGIYLVKKFEQFPAAIERPTLECMTLLANPKAIAANRRYIDRDLNRCFGDADLANAKLRGYEDQRAKEIAAQLGPKDHPKVDFIIDLHSTTANMGLTILPTTKHPFNLRLAGYLSHLNPDVRVCCGVQCSQDTPMLRSLSPFGCTIEVGAIAQGVLDAQRLEQTEMLIHAILDYLNAINQGTPLPVPSDFTLYQAIASVDYPRNASGELQAMIHPQLQFKDYEPLHNDAPMFLSFAGETISYQGEDLVYPIFINEAAYYEKNIAIVFTQKQQFKLETA